MKLNKLATACLLALLLAFFIFSLVSAHQTVTVGPYIVEIGWLSEPPIVGQMNAIVMNLSTSDGNDTPVTESISGLSMSVSYGGQSRILTLQPLGEDTPGQYVAPMLPTIPGLYTVDVTGKLGVTDVKVEVQPEEVDAAASVQFPIVATTSSAGGLGLAGWVALTALAAALAALALAVLGLRKSR